MALIAFTPLVYHVFPPTIVKEVEEAYDVAPKPAIAENLQQRSFLTFRTAPKEDFYEARTCFFFNSDCEISVAAPSGQKMDYFYKNAQADEMIFIHEGSGVLKTGFGSIKFGYGDYLVIPRGVVYQMEFDTPDNRLLIAESNSPIISPQRYRNEFGQLMAHSPFYERDIRKPENLETFDEEGDFRVLIKKQGKNLSVCLRYPPIRLCWLGWILFSVCILHP